MLKIFFRLIFKQLMKGCDNHADGGNTETLYPVCCT